MALVLWWSGWVFFLILPLPQTDISYMSTPNLGFEIAVSTREREQSIFRGSREGAGGSKGERRGSTTSTSVLITTMG